MGEAAIATESPLSAIAINTGSGSPSMSQSFPLVETENDITVSLTNLLALGDAPALHESLLEALAKDKDLILNGKAVELVSTPVIQVLLAGGRAAEKNGVTFVFINTSSVLAEAFEELGFGDELRRWSKG